MGTELLISFSAVSLNEAGSDAEDLKRHLEMVAPGVEVEQRRADSRAQDMGAILAIILAGPAVVAVSKGIADWIRMQGKKKPGLVISNSEGKEILRIDDMSSGDLRALLEGKIGDTVGQ
jgi:hypothetical protein